MSKINLLLRKIIKEEIEKIDDGFDEDKVIEYLNDEYGFVDLDTEQEIREYAKEVIKSLHLSPKYLKQVVSCIKDNIGFEE